MGLVSGIELLFVLCIIGILLLLGIRMRLRSHTVLLIAIITLLLLALISLSKITLTLFGILMFLVLMVLLFVFLSFAPRKPSGA